MANPKTLKSWKRAAKSEPAQPVLQQTVAFNNDSMSFFGTRADSLYVKWLAETRSISLSEAFDYCRAMDQRTLISESHEQDDRAPTPAKKWRLKSKWWKPQPLRSPAFTQKQISHQTWQYRQWLKARDERQAIEIQIAA